MEKNKAYPGFAFAPKKLTWFRVEGTAFIISKVDGDITNYEPGDAEGFCLWLLENGVKDIDGDSIYNGFLL